MCHDFLPRYEIYQNHWCTYDTLVLCFGVRLASYRRQQYRHTPERLSTVGCICTRAGSIPPSLQLNYCSFEENFDVTAVFFSNAFFLEMDYVCIYKRMIQTSYESSTENWLKHALHTAYCHFVGWRTNLQETVSYNSSLISRRCKENVRWPQKVQGYLTFPSRRAHTVKRHTPRNSMQTSTSSSWRHGGNRFVFFFVHAHRHSTKTCLRRTPRWPC